jgi:uncharacterized protein (TIGR03084 family)
VPAALDPIDALVAEQDSIEALLAGLTDEQWQTDSAATGWTVSDVVLHLAQSEEFVVASAGGSSLVEAVLSVIGTDSGATTMDSMMDALVTAQRTTPDATFERWRSARRKAVDALRATPADVRLPWAAAPLKPNALATTRLAEHWAHALDIAEGLGVGYPDTDRLQHIAWLAHRTLPYGFSFAGEEPRDVYVELTAPDGSSTWRYGDANTESTITGPAGDFCRVAAQRLRPEDSQLQSSGPHGATALRVLRTYAG